MEISSNVKKTIVLVFRILLGCVFVFSGYVKAVDPLGSTYKFQDYLGAMGLDFLAPLALVAGVLLAALEFLLGVCLLLGANIKSTSVLTFLLMCFMTPLTLWIAIADPVSDCGCFGDALVISNWATFWKNVVLIVMAFVVMKWQEHSPKLFSQRTEWIIAIASGAYSILISIYCYFNLPIIDFRPYKNGTNIPESMEVPEGAPVDEYETSFIFENADGQLKKVSMEEYSSVDTAVWKFKDSESVLTKKGYEPPIHDFTMEDPENGDITEDVVNNPGYTFLLVSYRVEGASTMKRKEINAIYDYARNNGYGFYCMTATGLETTEMREYKVEMGGVEYPIVNTDEITLKTIVRSNPGLVLIKDGVIINKWSNKNMPSFDEPLENSPRGEVQTPNDMRVILLSSLFFLGVLVALFALDKIVSQIVDRFVNLQKK
jgi:uncharacterized membrane protein YphA (DoxX/SURF4 family)